jgi:hypothetical protein
MPLPKWVRCTTKITYDKRCSDAATYVVIDEEHGNSESPHCGDHAAKATRSRAINSADLEKYGTF